MTTKGGAWRLVYVWLVDVGVIDELVDAGRPGFVARPAQLRRCSLPAPFARLSGECFGGHNVLPVFPRNVHRFAYGVAEWASKPELACRHVGFASAAHRVEGAAVWLHDGLDPGRMAEFGKVVVVVFGEQVGDDPVKRLS